MGKARQIAINSFIKRYGLKLCWLAICLDMDEALLRYHIKAGLNDAVLIKKFKALIIARAAAMIADLEEIQD